MDIATIHKYHTIMAERRTREARERIKVKALSDYRNGHKLREIAIRYGTSTTAVSLWAKEARLPRRDRGCRPKVWPDEEDIEIVKAVKAVVDGKPTLDEIGVQFGNKSRAGIHRIWKRWKDWKPTMPYKKGDRIRIKSHDYVVTKPGVFWGEVEDVCTGERITLPWKHKVDRDNSWQAVKLSVA